MYIFYNFKELVPESVKNKYSPVTENYTEDDVWIALYRESKLFDFI